MNVEMLKSLLLDAIVPPPAPPVEGPRQCCADAAVVIICDGDIDTWECWICGRTWEAPCQ